MYKLKSLERLIFYSKENNNTFKIKKKTWTK